jgi:hypothetical protein
MKKISCDKTKALQLRDELTILVKKNGLIFGFHILYIINLRQIAFQFISLCLVTHQLRF